MYIGWFKDVPEEEKADREKSIRSALLVLSRLDEMLQEESNLLDRQETDPTIYDSPNWDYKQAHKNGARGAFEKVRKIISVD
jgi:hypothetical protein